MAFFGTQVQVTPKGIVQSGQNSNSSKILWLSWLPASLKMIQLKVKAPDKIFSIITGKCFVAQGQVTQK